MLHVVIPRDDDHDGNIIDRTQLGSCRNDFKDMEDNITKVFFPGLLML